MRFAAGGKSQEAVRAVLGFFHFVPFRTNAPQLRTQLHSWLPREGIVLLCPGGAAVCRHCNGRRTHSCQRAAVRKAMRGGRLTSLVCQQGSPHSFLRVSSGQQCRSCSPVCSANQFGYLAAPDAWIQAKNDAQGLLCSIWSGAERGSPLLHVCPLVSVGTAWSSAGPQVAVPPSSGSHCVTDFVGYWMEGPKLCLKIVLGAEFISPF